MTPPSLARALDEFNANDLGDVLRAAGVADVPKTKQDKVLLWLGMVGDPTRIQRSLGQLAPTSRRALEILQASQGELRTVRFRSILQRAGVAAPEEPSLGYRSPSTKLTSKKEQHLPGFSELLAALLRSGLVWTHTLHEGMPGNAKIGLSGGRYIYIPNEVAKHLPPPPIKEHALPQVDHVLTGSARICQRELYLMWSANREAPLQLTSAGLLRVSDLKRVAGQMLVPETFTTGSKESDYRRLFFLRRLAMALELLSLNLELGTELESLATPGFFVQEPPERVRRSFESWRDGAWWNELWATYVQSSTTANGSMVSSAESGIVSARRTVIETLALLVRQAEAKQQPSAAWVSLDDIADYLHDRNDEFLVDRETAERQYGGYGYRYGYASTAYSPYQYNKLGWSWSAYHRSEEAGWNGVERVFVQAVLTEALYWLGLVDLGYAMPVTPQGGAAPEGLLAVRLTDMGRWLLLDAPPPAIPEESGRVVVQPNFRIFAFDPISDAVLARLDSFANRLNAERAIEYELTRDAVYRAQLNGQSAYQIQAWLEQVTGASLPQNVARSLAEWQAAFERIIVRGRVGWLEAASADLIDVVLKDSRLRQAVIKRVIPTGLIVQADWVAELEQALLAAEELPARNSQAETARRASITVAEDGRISFVHPVPSLYVYGYLRPFCEQVEGSWQITPRSVARASAASIDAAAVLAHLEAMVVGSVPDALRAKIKAWSQHYGTATVQTLTLVQFRDQAALDELQADPVIARYLQPFKPEARLGLAVAAPGDVAAVVALLIDRGVDIRHL